jgi:hypothetical protein
VIGEKAPVHVAWGVGLLSVQQSVRDRRRVVEDEEQLTREWVRLEFLRAAGMAEGDYKSETERMWEMVEQCQEEL